MNATGAQAPDAASAEARRLAERRYAPQALVAKRLVDVVGASLLLVLSSPLWVLVAALVKATSEGPVLFRQDRLGLGGRPFALLKFRSMRVDRYAAAGSPEGPGLLRKSRDDPRITRVGRWLRRTSVDELPQLVNVLRGDMSLVGPRPLLPFMLAHLPEFARRRATVRPGLTGLWQIRDRGRNTSAEYMIGHDLEYIDRWSLGLDVRILVATVWSVLSAAGAD